MPKKRCSSKWMTRERKGTFSKACSNVPGQASIAPWKHLSGPASIQKWSHFKDTTFSWTICSICPSVVRALGAEALLLDRTVKISSHLLSVSSSWLRPAEAVNGSRWLEIQEFHRYSWHRRYMTSLVYERNSSPKNQPKIIFTYYF